MCLRVHLVNTWRDIICIVAMPLALIFLVVIFHEQTSLIVKYLFFFFPNFIRQNLHIRIYVDVCDDTTLMFISQFLYVYVYINV